MAGESTYAISGGKNYKQLSDNKPVSIMATIPNVVLKTGFKTIICDFLRDSTVDKGKNLSESKHVFDVQECDGEITGKVIRQMSVNAAPYLQDPSSKYPWTYIAIKNKYCSL